MSADDAAITGIEVGTMNTARHSTNALLAAAMVLTLGIGVLASPVLAAGPPTVGLGTAAPFAVLAGTPAITNTGPSTITGDVGIAPALALTGFPPGTISGATHLGDAVAIQAKSDLTTAYTDAAGRSSTATHATLGGLTLVAGVYNAGGATLGLTGTLTLDGQNDPNAVWIFQATSDLVTASSSTVRFVNGGSACNVFWQVTSSATLGSGSTFVGTIMALTSITMASGVTLDGRALARNGAVTLIDDTITSRACPASSPTATPGSGATLPPTATPGSGATLPPTATPGSAPTLPPTDTAAPTDVPRSGVMPIALLVGTFVFAFVVLLAGRGRARANRDR